MRNVRVLRSISRTQRISRTKLPPVTYRAPHVDNVSICRSQANTFVSYAQIAAVPRKRGFRTPPITQSGHMLNPLKTQGVARTSTLLRQGVSRNKIASEISRGSLVRPRKGWVARPTADPALLYAARHGVLLTCITQAKRSGLWVLSEREHHFATRAASSRGRPEGILHWRTALVPRDPDSLEDPLENALNAVAHCQPFEEAVAIWDSALNKRLVEWQTLSKLPLTGRAKKVLLASNRFADSGLESYVRTRLAWLRIRIVAQAWLYGHRVDFLIGARLVLQIDGSQHTGAQRSSDNQHDAELRLRGYEIIRVTYTQVMFDWPTVQQQIMLAVAQGKHLAA